MSVNKINSSPIDTDAIADEIAGAILELDEIGDTALEVARRAGELSAQLHTLYQRIRKDD